MASRQFRCCCIQTLSSGKPGSACCRAFAFRESELPSHFASCDSTSLLFAQNDFALADELIVQPKAIFIGSAFETWPRGAAQQANAGRRLKNI